MKNRIANPAAIAALGPMMIGGEAPGSFGNLGLNRGANRKPKNLDNSPDRAKGMRGFPIKDGEWLSYSHLDELIGGEACDEFILTGNLPDGCGIDVVYAGTPKAAIKKWWLLKKCSQ